MLVALLVFGPKSLPDVARLLAKATRELRRLTTEFQRELNMMDLEGDEGRRVQPPESRTTAKAAPTLSSTPPEGTVQQASASSPAPAGDAEAATAETKSEAPPAG